MGESQFDLDTDMYCSHNSGHHGERPVPALIVCDLRAQLAPLNRYGPSGLGAAVVDGLGALISASRTAFARPSLVARRTELT
jgi:hypothetical protein